MKPFAMALAVIVLCLALVSAYTREAPVDGSVLLALLSCAVLAALVGSDDN